MTITCSKPEPIESFFIFFNRNAILKIAIDEKCVCIVYVWEQAQILLQMLLVLYECKSYKFPAFLSESENHNKATVSHSSNRNYITFKSRT